MADQPTYMAGGGLGGQVGGGVEFGRSGTVLFLGAGRTTYSNGFGESLSANGFAVGFRSLSEGRRTYSTLAYNFLGVEDSWDEDLGDYTLKARAGLQYLFGMHFGAQTGLGLRVGAGVGYILGEKSRVSQVVPSGEILLTWRP